MTRVPFSRNITTLLPQVTKGPRLRDCRACLPWGRIKAPAETTCLFPEHMTVPAEGVRGYKDRGWPRAHGEQAPSGKGRVPPDNTGPVKHAMSMISKKNCSRVSYPDISGVPKALRERERESRRDRLTAEQLPWLKLRSPRPGRSQVLRARLRLCPRGPLGTYQLIPVDLVFLLLGYPAK